LEKKEKGVSNINVEILISVMSSRSILPHFLLPHYVREDLKDFVETFQGQGLICQLTIGKWGRGANVDRI